MLRMKIPFLLFLAFFSTSTTGFADDETTLDQTVRGVVSADENKRQPQEGGDAQPEPPPPPPTDRRETDPRMNELWDSLQSMQDEIKRLREQQEVRRRLEITDEEKKAQEKEILQAAGREYTTMKKDTLGLEYNFNYQYYSYDIISQATEVERHANHNLTNSMYIEYAFLDNLTWNLNMPFVYKWDKTGTDQSISTTELDDISTGLQYQPLRSKEGWPVVILLGRVTFPTGQSPYEININEELATGNGYYSAFGGLSLSKTIDPVIAFGNIGYTYNFKDESLSQRRNGLELTGISPGDSISGSVGMGFSLSYNVSMNFSYQYSYQMNTQYTWREIPKTDSGSRTSSLFYIGAGFRLSQKYSINLKVGIGLTDEDPDFVVGFRIPFQFASDG
ncbi:hypothetical protein DSCA_19690 [Desulfosarcina alkanivorans]|uniref:Transporter n=2 Tax=Desulfosarcina alkanivorans TaxID=571177 RepID=A0A5K7YJM5_9BACT|nr:hypothetical protein DSCA_19690 [Desulfosarcina alkanivorans]